ncbi:MAG: beta-L-arabinofuranosidase domain-containing protein, partial [Streptosporangiaceae bacterium]
MSDASALSAPETRPGFGPAIPSPATAVALRPLPRGAARISGGLLHDWQERNRATSLPLALRQLEAAGNLGNLRLVISGASEGYKGPVFMDSDIYKTLEAVSWEVARQPSAELTEFAREVTALLEEAQQPDGYLNSYVQVTGRPRYANLAFSHELYCAGHLIQAAVASQRGLRGSGAEAAGYAAGSGHHPAGVMHEENGFSQTALFGVARRFADHLVKEFLGTQDGLDGHPIVETALVELYRETGYEPYLRLAGQFVE